jgi:UDP-N-acetylglucosamine--N-acetylmuramyl-(pentapeptide) pyrophosphoryl-undecaprenol N-acetylglucosamine transferase
LAVARKLVETDPEIRIEFIGQRGDKSADVVEDSGLTSAHYRIIAGKFRRFHSLTLWQNITNFRVNLLNARDAMYVVCGFFQSLYILIKHRPDVIFFKGGFVVVPVGTAARLLRIPYITHDSDAIPGLANRLIAPGAKRNAVVNQDVTAYPIRKTIVTGIPLIDEYDQRAGSAQATYKKKLGLPLTSLVLFVYTGTQGARAIDDELENIIPELLKSFPNLHVNYVFGRLNEDSMRSRYQTLSKDLSSRLHRFTFISNAFDHIAAADLIIGRAGATTLAEFSTIGRACIIIPAEQLTGGQQLHNVKPYIDHDAAVVLRSHDMKTALMPAMDELLRSQKRRDQLAERIRLITPANAAQKIADELIDIGRNS